MTTRLKLVDDALYQVLTQRAASDERWAAYFLLVNACYEIAKTIPETREVCDLVDIEQLLIQGLEHMGKAVCEILPGGAEEFYHYMPTPQKVVTSS